MKIFNITSENAEKSININIPFNFKYSIHDIFSRK